MVGGRVGFGVMMKLWISLKKGAQPVLTSDELSPFTDCCWQRFMARDVTWRPCCRA